MRHARRTPAARFLVALAALAFAAVAVPATVAATTALQLDLESLVAHSDAVVEARVRHVEARVEEGKVFTYTELEVTDALKGEPGQTVTIRQIGGRTAELETRVHGVPSFEVDERVVVFLEQPRAASLPVVAGLAQGKFKIAQAPDGATDYVIPTMADLNLVAPAFDPDLLDAPDRIDPDAARFQHVGPADVHQAIVTLEDFKDRIRATVEDQRTQP